MTPLYPAQDPPSLQKESLPRSHLLQIAVSGKSGCGNSTVSRLLSEELGISLVNYTFRNLSDELGISIEDIAQRAQWDRSIDFHLDHMQAHMAKSTPCVLASRLAIWLLPEAWIRVYLEASPNVRASRIQKREGGSFTATYEDTVRRDREDETRYANYYALDINDYRFADLIIATDSLKPEEIVQHILNKLGPLREATTQETQSGTL